MVFLPLDESQSKRCQKIFEQVILEEEQEFLGWRDVPTDDSLLGPTAKDGEPTFKQIFIGKNNSLDSKSFDRKLYIIRKRVESLVWNSDMTEQNLFYIPSLSYRTFLYKGMLTGTQIEPMFPDLSEMLNPHWHLFISVFQLIPCQSGGLLILLGIYHTMVRLIPCAVIVIGCVHVNLYVSLNCLVMI